MEHETESYELPSLYHWLGRDAGEEWANWQSYVQLAREAGVIEATEHDE